MARPYLHGYDLSQRHVELAVSSIVNGVGINVCRPAQRQRGAARLLHSVLLNGRGSPSVSRPVRLDPNALDAAGVAGKKKSCKKKRKGKKKGKAKKSKRKKGKAKKRCKKRKKRKKRN